MGTLTNSQSFIFGDSNWKFCSRLPHRPPKTWHSDAYIYDLGRKKICFYFAVKKSKPVGYTRTLYSQTGENTKCAETFVWCLLLIFKVVYQDHLTQLLPFTRDFVAAAGLGPSGLTWCTQTHFQHLQICQGKGTQRVWRSQSHLQWQGHCQGEKDGHSSHLLWRHLWARCQEPLCLKHWKEEEHCQFKMLPGISGVTWSGDCRRGGWRSWGHICTAV